MSTFAPLHIVSGYSFLQSGLTMDKIRKAIKANDFYGAGISDNQVMYGIAQFVRAMESVNKPFIVGMTVTINGDNLSLYVLNEEGYRNLIKINSEIQKETLTLDFIKQHSEGLICIIETKYGQFRENFEKEEKITTSFTKYLLQYASIFKDDFYLGIEVNSRDDISYANKVRDFAEKYTYECVAFPRIKYVKKDDAIALKIVEAIDKDETLDIKTFEGNEYFMSELDYKKIYTQEEIENTIEIVNKSSFSFHQKRGEIVKVNVDDPKNYLKELCFNKLKEKGLDNDQKHIERLNYELEVISSMGYVDYFLVVQDYVNYAKNNEILVGPGRGSAAGSLVSYLLNITEVDPLDFNLQFERFLNPFRKTMPDIDVDFMDIKRDQMVQYMRDKYGVDKVANIVTYQTILAKQALRDVGRVYNYKENHISLLSKQLTNKDYSLRESYKYLPEFKKLVDSDKYFLEIVSLASKIEGLPRQEGMHAAGIVLNNNPLDESVPVSIDFNGNYKSQYEAGYLEEQGFLKMDFLGLKNLTIIYNCVNLINKNHPEIHLDPLHVPYDEKEVYQLIASGQTMGIFQLESAGMKKAIRIIKPDSFDEIVKLLALFRPGPMDSIKTYVNRRDGKENFTYISDDLKDVLEPTKGIIVYQEQINDIARIMAGFSLAEADLFRRAVSKKDKEKLESGRLSFINGAKAKGYSEKTAVDVFNHIMKFAEYGFNKSHSVVYSIISCRMAWLKYHYPLEFYASILDTGSSSDGTTFNDYVAEMKLRNYSIASPNINKSSNSFVIWNNKLLYPLTKIKNIGDQLVNKIIEERSQKEFTSFFDFITRMFVRGITADQLKQLINAGAFDSLCSNRNSLMASMARGLQYAELVSPRDGQTGFVFSSIPEPALVEEEETPIDNLEKEYDVLGLMLSNSPLHYKKEQLDKYHVKPIIEAKNEVLVGSNSQSYTLSGILKNKKVITTKKNEKMAFVKIYDETSDLEITVFPRLYENVNSLLEKNKILIVKGKFDQREDEQSFMADEITLLED